MTNFVYDNVALPEDKVDASGGSSPVANPTRKWSPNDANRVFRALEGTRTALLANAVNINQYGVLADGGVANQTTNLLTAINSTQGRTLYIPKGKYRFDTKLSFLTSTHHIVGDYGTADSAGGTELVFMGTGTAIEFGAEDLVHSPNWDTNWYQGLAQDIVFENIAITHGAPDTALASNPGAGSSFKAGSYGIWDWYGGSLRLIRCRLTRFEANFVGIQSDVNRFIDCSSHYSKYGIYLGPRSDQCLISGLYSFLCDRSVTIDRASGARIHASEMVNVGHATASPIEYRRGSSGLNVVNCWFEHLTGAGYQGTDQQSFISAGEVDGYGAGGSVQSAGASPTTSAAQGLLVDSPLCYTVATATAGHTKYVITAGKCNAIELRHPSIPVGNSLTNFDSLVGVQAGQSPSGSDTQIYISGAGVSNTDSKNYTNIGGGSPIVRLDVITSGGSNITAGTTGTLELRALGATTGAEKLQITQNNVAGNVHFIAPTYASGQTTRLGLTRSIQYGTAAPVAGTWQQGDIVFNTAAAAGGKVGFVCTAGGTPGTWKAWGPIDA